MPGHAYYWPGPLAGAGAGTTRARPANPQHAHQPGHTIFGSTLGHVCVCGGGSVYWRVCVCLCVCVVGLEVLRQQLFRRLNCAKSENLTKSYFICEQGRTRGTVWEGV